MELLAEVVLLLHLRRKVLRELLPQARLLNLPLGHLL